MFFEHLRGEIAYWGEEDIWETNGNVINVTIDRDEICSKDETLQK